MKTATPPIRYIAQRFVSEFMNRATDNIEYVDGKIPTGYTSSLSRARLFKSKSGADQYSNFHGGRTIPASVYISTDGTNPEKITKIILNRSEK